MTSNPGPMLAEEHGTSVSGQWVVTFFEKGGRLMLTYCDHVMGELFT
jgi:hypothetical protein